MSSESENGTAKLQDWGDRLDAYLEPPSSEDQLQQRRVHQLRRQLSEHFSSVAIFLDWLAEMNIAIGAHDADCGLLGPRQRGKWQKFTIRYGSRYFSFVLPTCLLAHKMFNSFPKLTRISN